MSTRVLSERAALGLAEQLAPVRRALIEDAHRQAQTLLSDAAVEAEQIEADASAERETAISGARAKGVAAGEHEAARDAARARRTARARVLAAQRAVYDDLVAAVVAAVSALRTDPGYPDLLEGWSALARAQLGPDALVTRDPSPDGGVIATLDDRRVDYTVTALAERELARLAQKVGGLWH